MTNCEPLERPPIVLAPHRRHSSSVEIEMKDTEVNPFITQTLHLFLKWATQSHPSDVVFTAQNLVEGVGLVELLVSFSNDHFGDLLDRLSTNSDETGSGLIRKVELIREQLRSFYAEKSPRPLDEATSFLAPASEIDEDSLMRLMIVVYGVAVSLNHMSAEKFEHMLKASNTEVYRFTKQMVKEFTAQLSENSSLDTTQETDDLKSKLKQSRIEIAHLRDENERLESQLSNKENELTNYAKINAMRQEAEMKMQRWKQLQEELRNAEEHCSKFECQVSELDNRVYLLSSELDKTRETLKATKDELREVRDNKATLEHRLSLSNARAEEMERKFVRLQEETKDKPSGRDHAALMERYSTMLDRNSELEQQCQALESYKMLLESHKAQLEQVKSEKELVLTDLYAEQQRNRELKSRLSEIEDAKLSSRIENAEQVTSTGELVNLKVEVSNLQLEKKGLKEELARSEANIESERERSGVVLAQVQMESEQLALKHETLQNEFVRQKQELDSLLQKRMTPETSVETPVKTPTLTIVCVIMSRPALNSLRGLLTRPETEVRFTNRVSQLKSIRTVDEGVPRKEEQQRRLIRSFRSLRHRLAQEEATFQPGDSAVLVPLIELSEDQQPWVLFTQRSFHMRSHRGEVSFPGGRMDENETPEQAAFREAEEEIGLHFDDIRLWGRLPSLLTRHNKNVVTPVVGLIAERALKKLVIDTEEVQSIFIAPLAELAQSQSYTAFRVASHLYRMPVYHSEQFRLLKTNEQAIQASPPFHRIWGLSGGILAELLAVLFDDHELEEM
ncbi:Hydrolase, NUDIX family [Aphelenchoides besseyi]|nr:Hydrolase, NUDIX family [Aphelenchoides besseyi]